MLKQERILKLHKWFLRQEQKLAVVFLFLLVAFAAYCLYDVQTAQGVGLYLSIVWDSTHSRLWDLAICGSFLLLFCAAVLLPCILLKRKDPLSILRFLALYMTFIPTISTAYLVHLPGSSTLWSLHPALLQGDFANLFIDASQYLMPLLQLGLPALFLLAACHKAGLRTSQDTTIETVSNKKASLPTWHKMLLGIIIILLVVLVLFSELTQVSEYIIWYFLLLILFHMWEDQPGSNQALHTGNWLITLFFIITGIYRLLELTSHFRL